MHKLLVQHIDDILKNYDENVNELHYEKLFSLFLSEAFSPICVSLDKGASLHRLRINDNNKLFSNINRLKNPPSKCVVNYNRLNRPGQSVFYCSENYSICQIELLNNYTSSHKINLQKKITYSKWQTDTDLTLLLIYSLEGNKTGFGLKFNELFEGIVKTLSAKERLITESFYREVWKYFITPSKNSQKPYLVTSAIANALFSVSNVDGIVYPSVQSHCSGYNIAFSDKVIKSNKIKPVEIYVQKWSKILPDKVEVNQKSRIAGKLLGNKIIWEKKIKSI